MGSIPFTRSTLRLRRASCGNSGALALREYPTRTLGRTICDDVQQHVDLPGGYLLSWRHRRAGTASGSLKSAGRRHFPCSNSLATESSVD
jgi:hypothetical protein